MLKKFSGKYKSREIHREHKLHGCISWRAQLSLGIRLFKQQDYSIVICSSREALAVFNISVS